MEPIRSSSSGLSFDENLIHIIDDHRHLRVGLIMEIQHHIHPSTLDPTVSYRPSKVARVLSKQSR